MNLSNRPNHRGWAIILLCATTLALGGCGRKGGLDMPPNASSSQAAAAAAADSEAEQAARSGTFNPSSAGDTQLTAPKGRKKAFVLDPLLD